MKINNHNINAFFTLIKEGTFTKASKSLGISQPALTQRIQALEAQLEQTLITRSRTGVVPTPLGQKLLSYVTSAQSLENEFLDQLKDDSSSLKGQIRIAGFSSVMRSLIIPELSKIIAKNPDLTLQTYTDELINLPQYLLSSKVDYLVHNRALDKDGFESILIAYEENVLVRHKSLKNQDYYLDHDENDITTSSYFKLSKKEKPKRFHYLDDVYGLLDGVKLGLGRAVIPKHLIDTKNIIIENPKVSLRVPIYLIYRKSPFYTNLHYNVLKKIRDIAI